jgi:putative ABC transport system permease protein
MLPASCFKLLASVHRQPKNMIKNYIVTALRNLRKNKAHSFINIAGLSVGMAVAMLIGLWIWNELSFNKYHKNYDHVAQVMLNQDFNGSTETGVAIPIALDAVIRKSYGSDFRHIAMVSWTESHILATGEKKLSFDGTFMDKEGPEIFSLRMLKGSRNGLQDPSSILISQSVSKALFGDTDPMGKMILLDNKSNFKVSGVYEDLPPNSSLHELSFLAPWDYYLKTFIPERVLSDWGDNSWQMYVQIADGTDMSRVSGKIRNAIMNNAGKEDARFKPLIFLQPMSNWRLYSEFKNGVNTGGAIQYVWMFGIIGIFVLLLACINFMNLSTARSEKRAKEVGIRKAVGSLRSQLIIQFYCESILTTVFAFTLALIMVALALPFFNQLADKQMTILWSNGFFWILCTGFTLFTALIAGSYPALYLSSFRPVKVLKGVFKAGRLAAVPRKALVVLQFTVSVVLIVGTIIVFNQIQFAKNRPVGYNRNGLIFIGMQTDDLHNHFDALSADLKSSGAVTYLAQSSSSTTGVENNRSGLVWKGKDPNMTDDFANIRVTTDYGKTVAWQFVDGRDFSNQFLTDSLGLIINEAAVKYMNLKNPVGENIRVGRNKVYHVIGVVKDMVMSSPYEPAKQTIYYITHEDFSYVIMRLNPNMSAHESIQKIEAACKTYSPSVPFSFQFADESYARKFSNEERIGKLASLFAVLAIFISCLGLFGMATFTAEQRIKEIGVRKVLGASVFSLWRLLSRDFVNLVVISLLISIPAAYYFMGQWLQHYEYRSPMPWWVFAAAGAGAIIITLLTVSFQSIHAALMNPTKSLKTE